MYIANVSLSTGSPQRLENLENENGQGKVRDHEKMVKGLGKL